MGTLLADIAPEPPFLATPVGMVCAALASAVGLIWFGVWLVRRLGGRHNGEEPPTP